MDGFVRNQVMLRSIQAELQSKSQRHLLWNLVWSVKICANSALELGMLSTNKDNSPFGARYGWYDCTNKHSSVLDLGTIDTNTHNSVSELSMVPAKNTALLWNSVRSTNTTLLWGTQYIRYNRTSAAMFNIVHN